MGRPGIRELVGRAMIEKEFLAELVRDPDTVLTRYDLDPDEKKGGHAGGRPLRRDLDADRARAGLPEHPHEAVVHVSGAARR
jgi:hypothetical protein